MPAILAMSRRAQLSVALAIGGSLCLSAGMGVPTSLGADHQRLLPVAASRPADEPRITVVGTRISRGDAVECPKLRTEDGTVLGVSYLAPSIRIGDRVSVTGFFAVVTHCRGRVLYAESTQVLDGT